MRVKLYKMLAILLLPMMMLLPVNAAEDWMQKEAALPHITDQCEVVSENERMQLEEKAEEIRELYDFGIYAVIVEDYEQFGDASIRIIAEEIYKTYSLGEGSEKEGILLLLSMEERDYSLIVHGSIGNSVFNDNICRSLEEKFLDDFAYDDWYAGLSDYISWSEEYLTDDSYREAFYDESFYEEDEYVVPQTRRVPLGTMLLIVFLVPLAVAAIYVSVLTGKMKSVASATKAAAYVSGNLNLRKKVDRFTHMTETRHKISKDSGGSARGGGSRSFSGGRSSGGFSGRSGKF